MNEPSPKISVVIPVYKVEDTLQRCVDSVLRQTYTNLEIILVNDGSPDKCGEICDNFLTKDNRVKVIHQKNQGLSMARNNGMNQATGTYIAFVDSDDYVDLKIYEILLANIIKNNLKMVMCAFYNGDKISYRGKLDTKDVQDVEESLERIAHPGYFNAWNKLYSLELVKNIPFIKGKIYEDILFNSQVVKRISKIGFVPQPLYYYSVDGESIIRSAYDKRKLEGFWVIKEAMDNFKEVAKTDRIKEILRINFLSSSVFHFHSVLANPSLDPKGTNAKEMRELILANSKKPYQNWYVKLINILPLSLYRIFYKINLFRIKLNQDY